ncbi:hypothetical protein OG905_37100 [Streptomyces sp. NBC_00322]|uniref:hypothetical protein n=1 Tax=Streptomyces sp. NBC_00322 TaxID=2975712 RepID=UPI002E2B172B|nr:hypothetical protein [Streptomyces sp. NBC_00322]
MEVAPVRGRVTPGEFAQQCPGGELGTGVCPISEDYLARQDSGTDPRDGGTETFTA